MDRMRDMDRMRSVRAARVGSGWIVEQENWARRESNPHPVFPDRILNPARLPFRHGPVFVAGVIVAGRIDAGNANGVALQASLARLSSSASGSSA